MRKTGELPISAIPIGLWGNLKKGDRLDNWGEMECTRCFKKKKMKIKWIKMYTNKLQNDYVCHDCRKKGRTDVIQAMINTQKRKNEIKNKVK